MSKDEMNDLQEVRREDPELEHVIARIRRGYELAQSRPEISKPLAYTLKKIWREVDHSEVPRVRE